MIRLDPIRPDLDVAAAPTSRYTSARLIEAHLLDAHGIAVTGPLPRPVGVPASRAGDYLADLAAAHDDAHRDDHAVYRHVHSDRADTDRQLDRVPADLRAAVLAEAEYTHRYAPGEIATHVADAVRRILEGDPLINPRAAQLVTDAARHHAHDGDCTVGDDGTCVVCGVEHELEGCPGCGARAFHAPDCAEVPR